jgi:hypothetical protein
MYGDLIRGILGIIAAAVTCLLASYNAFLFVWMKDKLQFNDFGRFYYSSVAYLQHRSMYERSPATLIKLAADYQAQLWNMNPPHFGLMILPLAHLSPLGAYAVWLAIAASSCAAAVWLITKECNVRANTNVILWAALAILGWAPFSAQIITGQLGWVMMWPLTAAWVAMRRDKWIKSAVFWGACISVKPFLVTLLPYFLVRRQWRAAAVATGTVAGMFLVSFGIVGINEHRAWLTAVSESQSWAWLTMNASTYALFARAFGGGPQLHPVAAAPQLVKPLWMVTSGALAAAAVWAVTIRPRDVDRDVLLLILLALLVSPLGWIYYLWWIVGPAVAFYCARRRLSTSARVAIACLFWPFVATVVGQPHPWATVTIASIYAWALLLLFASVVSDAMRSHSAARQSGLAAAI